MFLFNVGPVSRVIHGPSSSTNSIFSKFCAFWYFKSNFLSLISADSVHPESFLRPKKTDSITKLERFKIE